jgi:hypothetical protein
LLDLLGEPIDRELKLPAEKQIKLNGFEAQAVSFPIDMGPETAVLNSRSSDDYVLQVENLYVIDESDNKNPAPKADDSEPLMVDEFTDEMSFSLFPGRHTALQILLNDAMLTHDTINVTYDRDLFRSSNINPMSGKFQAFLSDYVMFDISAVASRPLLSSDVVAGKPASRVFVSGDNYALSVFKPYDPTSSNPSIGVFETLTPFGHIQGIFRPLQATVNLKTYELQQADPRDFDFDGPLHLITALKGYYRDYNEVLADMGSTEMILFPKTGDGPKQELVVIIRDTTRTDAPIVDMYFGEVDFSVKVGKKFEPRFKFWPISQLSPASIANQTEGVIETLTDSRGLTVDTTAENWWQNVRAGSFRVTSAAIGLPTSLLAGRATVFRL